MKALIDAEEAAAELSNIRSFLVMWDGAIVSEHYYGGIHAATLHHIRSITKSIVSTLVGIAIDKGVLQGVEDIVVQYIPEFKVRTPDIRKNQITIRQLLTMTSGFEWEETGQWFLSDTFSALSHAWDRPLVGIPGERYNYDSASTDLLTVILSRATNQDAQTFAIDNLFEPLGITNFKWEKDPAGYHRGSAGLVMTARDLAKIGQLYLQRGQWIQHQIISSQWIDQSFAQHVKVNNVVSYGYLWRSRQVGSIRHYYAMGYGGQYLIVVPDLKLVAVAIHKWQVSSEEADRQKYDFTDRVLDPMVEGLSIR